jgi:hypothetical protein
MAARLDEAAASEAGVIGDLSDRRLGQEEGLRCLVCGELGFGQDQAVQRWIEDVNAQWGTRSRVLDSTSPESEASRSYSAADK